MNFKKNIVIKLLFYFLTFQLVACIEPIHKKEAVRIVPFTGFYGKSGKEAYIHRWWDSVPQLTVNGKNLNKALKFYGHANYIFEGDIIMNIDSVKYHILNFLDTLKLDSIIQISFYKTSSVTNKDYVPAPNWPVPVDDHLADVFLDTVGNLSGIVIGVGSSKSNNLQCLGWKFRHPKNEKPFNNGKRNYTLELIEGETIEGHSAKPGE